MKLLCHFLVSLLFLYTSSALATDWQTVTGNVTYNGTPVCSMVLANGQYMFTCSGNGSFNLNVPLDENGQITVFAFCSGLAPYKQIIYPNAASNLQIAMQPGEDGVGMDINTSVQALSNTTARLSGTVTYGGAPVCSMLLANGQYMFTCSDGSFSLDVPLDEMGSITQFGFCEGLPPSETVFPTSKINYSTDIDGDGYSVAGGDCNDADPGRNPGVTDICGDGIDQDCSGSDADCSSGTLVSFSQAEIQGKTYELTDVDYPTCSFSISFGTDNKMTIEGEDAAYNYTIDNGIIEVSDGDNYTTTIQVIERSGLVATVLIRIINEAFVPEDSFKQDFSFLNNNATALADWFVTNGFWPNSYLTSDGHVVVANENVQGIWYVENNIFYFSYPEDGCVDYKAYKLINNKLMFSTDAEHTSTYTMTPH